MFDNQISASDLKYLDEKLLKIKENVLSDFVIHFLNGTEKLSEVKSNVIKKKAKINLKIKKEEKEIAEENRCMANIWSNGLVQCKKKRQDYSEYCSIHNKNRNYGRIDDSK